jgi:NADH:ubiquinone reductase (H+-translocating)
MVTKIEPGAIYIGDRRMEAAVVLWAAGVLASPLGRKLGVPVDRAGRVLVNADLSIPDHREVFVIGDLAALKDATGKWLPGVAPVAMQEARYVAKLIRQEIREKKNALGENGTGSAERASFRYHDKGSLATIGRAAAVGDFGKLHISGYLAWLAWLFVHIFFLIGFENRILVLTQWAWSYFTYERGARLITGSTTLPGWSNLRTRVHGAGKGK